MDQKRMQEQARVLQQKKLARMRMLKKQLQPKIEHGVVQFDRPQPQAPLRAASLPVPPPVKMIKSVEAFAATPQPPDPKKQPKVIDPKKTVQQKTQKGCSGCRRKLGK